MRRIKVLLVTALATAAMTLGATAAPASANHNCEHSVNQALKALFGGGSKAQIVKAINERFGTKFTVADVNNLIERYCANR